MVRTFVNLAFSHIRGARLLAHQVGVGGVMDAGRSFDASEGSQNPFDRLSDDLLLRLLIQASVTRKVPFEHAYASVDKLCLLRTVCSRFNKLVPEADRLLCDSDHHASKVLGFLQERRVANFFCLNADNVPPLFVQGLLATAPRLETLALVDAYQHESEDPVDERFKDLFKCLSLMCPRLRSLELVWMVVRGALLSRHSLTSLITLSLSEIDLDNALLLSITKIYMRLESLSLDEVSGLENPIIVLETLTTIAFRTSEQVESAMTDSLHIEAPRLVDLSVAYVLKLTICAPELTNLVLDYTWDIVRNTAWKLTTLDIKEGPTTVEELLHVLGLCRDARVLSIGKHVAAIHDGVYEGGVRISSLIHSFKYLEELHIPSVMSGFLKIEEEEALLLEPLAKLKKLSIGFSVVSPFFKLCLALIRVCPKLERLDIDLTDTPQQIVSVSSALRLVFRIRKMYTSLKIKGQLPKGFK